MTQSRPFDSICQYRTNVSGIIPFPDGGGFMDYGFGTNVKYAYAINDQISINAGLGY